MFIFLFLLLIFIFIGFILWLVFTITGGALISLFWLCIKVPLALLLFSLALSLCCTIILIPLGILLFKAGIRLLIPGY